MNLNWMLKSVFSIDDVTKTLVTDNSISLTNGSKSCNILFMQLNQMESLKRKQFFHYRGMGERFVLARKMVSCDGEQM